MSILELHTLPLNATILDSESSLCVFDPDGNLLADYGFSTGLRILGGSEEWTVYINDDDLVPGRWVLNLTTMEEELVKSRIEGFKEGTPQERKLTGDALWEVTGGNIPRVSLDERATRLSICTSCDLLDSNTMTCSVSGKSVLDQTTRRVEFCPEDLWGERKTPIPVPIISPEDQKQFEADLELFFGSE